MLEKEETEKSIIRKSWKRNPKGKGQVLKTWSSGMRVSCVVSRSTASARIAAHFYGDGIYENQIWLLEETTKINLKNLLTKEKCMI